MSGHNDPRLLFSLPGIRAYHLQNGHEDSLTPSGPQTLSLLMVPTSSQFADPSATHPQAEPHEEDFYLHLNLPPELDLPLPATTQIYHQPPRSYLIPRWDLGPESGAFTRIEFPPLGSGPGYVSQEDIDTFETILAQCTAFLERAQPPQPEKGGLPTKSYNPAEYQPGEAYVPGTGKPGGGHIVLIDEENGSVVGELGEGANVVEDPSLKPGSKSMCPFAHTEAPVANEKLDPVEIQISEDGKNVSVRPVDEEYLSMANHPAYKSSSMVQNAALASRLIVTGSSYISNAMTSGASTFSSKTKPNQKPLTFRPSTQTNIRKINSFTHGAAELSAKTVGSLSKYAQNMGASMTGKGPKQSKAFDKDGKPVGEYKPGLLNKSMIAFSTIADGIAYSGKNLLTSGGAAASHMVGHRYGSEAGTVAADLAGGVKNVGLVYIDVTGVSRRAVIKSVAKGMVVGRVSGGGEVVVGGGDGGVVPPDAMPPYQPGASNAPPPAYSSAAGDSPGGYGWQAPAKQ
jgi:spartin